MARARSSEVAADHGSRLDDGLASEDDVLAAGDGLARLTRAQTGAARTDFRETLLPVSCRLSRPPDRYAIPQSRCIHSASLFGALRRASICGDDAQKVRSSLSDMLWSS